MVGLQLKTGRICIVTYHLIFVVLGCSVRLCNSSELVADIIITYTKALADKPFKY